tara:strand:- start:433 stop:735 length:303 start_codon:yes stop_codon:yes gene_type:complete
MPLGNQTSRPAFDAANRGDAQQSQSRGSSMVERDRPHPAPHPSPGLAHDVDRAAFNAAWDREAREVEERNRAARRDAFKAARTTEPDTSRSRTFNRTVSR